MIAIGEVSVRDVLRSSKDGRLVKVESVDGDTVGVRDTSTGRRAQLCAPLANWECLTKGTNR